MGPKRSSQTPWYHLYQAEPQEESLSHDGSTKFWPDCLNGRVSAAAEPTEPADRIRFMRQKNQTERMNLKMH